MEKIILYTSSTCPHCRTAKNFLQEKGYAYVEKNVQTDPQATSELNALGVQGVPTFDIGGQVIVGFNPTAVDKALKTKLLLCPSCHKKMSVPKGKGKIRVTCPHCSHKFDVNS